MIAFVSDQNGWINQILDLLTRLQVKEGFLQKYQPRKDRKRLVNKGGKRGSQEMLRETEGLHLVTLRKMGS